MNKLYLTITLTAILLNSEAQENLSNSFFYVSSMDPVHTRGIALFEFNFKSGDITFVEDYDTETNSDYLTIREDGKYLYSTVQEQGSRSGLVTSFEIDEQTGDLTYLDEQYTDGYGPCHITVDQKEHFVIVAHYDGGSVSVMRMLKDGNLGKVTDKVTHEGSSINKGRQDSPHPHMAYPSPKGNYILVPDLGMDKILVYKFKSTGKLKPTKQKGIDLTPGAGPRHLDFHPSGEYCFVVNELNSTITSFSFNQSDGSLEMIGSILSIPSDFKEDNYLADIHVSKDGNYLYASNRGHNSISVVKIDQGSGELELLDNVDCGGDWPRAFNIDPTRNYLLVANERSDNIVVFSIDPSTGRLKNLNKTVEYPAPRCIKFLKHYH